MTFATDQTAIATEVAATLASAQTYLDKLVGAAAITFGAIPFTVDSILANNYTYPVVPALPDPVKSQDFKLNTTGRPDIGALIMPSALVAPDVSKLKVPSPRPIRSSLSPNSLQSGFRLMICSLLQPISSSPRCSMTRPF